MQTTQCFRIGAGAGFSADRLDPALDLARRARLDALAFECLGERTLAQAHRQRRQDPAAGYTPLLERRMQQILPVAHAAGTRIVTNMGAANPAGAADKTHRVAHRLGLSGLRIATVLGDDVSRHIRPDTPLLEPRCTVGALGRPMLGANAYLGADALLSALEAGADIVIAGRTSDPALFLAPLRHHFGWAEDDWLRLGRGIAVGHLLECAGQLTGGYFADPGFKDVPELARLGFPFADVAADGTATLGKLPDSGGCLTLQTVKEQLFYEVHDPAAYVTPDVVADFASLEPADAGPDRVSLSGGGGAPRPEALKVTVAFDGGYLAEAEASYAGPGAAARARLAGDILRALHATALAGDPVEADQARDVRLRCALRCEEREIGELLLWEMEAMLCCGPAGGGGYRGHITPSVLTYSAMLPRTLVRPGFEIRQVQP